MRKRNVFVYNILCAALSMFLTISALAQKEKEPNNTPGQANRIHVNEIVAGIFQDSYDYFSISLPNTGKTTVTLSGCPKGGQVQIGASDFGYAGTRQSNGKGTVSLTFDATRTDGFVWIRAIFAGSVCGGNWCASQFVAGGPFHVTRSSPNVPGSFQDFPILPPIQYTLTVKQTSTAGKTPKRSTALKSVGKAKSVAGFTMRQFKEDYFGFSFELPDYWKWELLPDRGGYMLSGPEGDEADELVIVIQAVKKASNPGSSVSKQLGQAKHQIKGFPGGEIHSEDITRVSGHGVTYFLAYYPGRTSQNQPAQFAHFQTVLEKGPHYYWISYAAPVDYFQKYEDVFSHMLATFQFTDAAAHSRELASSTSKPAKGRIEVKKFTSGGGSLFNPKVKVKARAYGSGAQLLRLFAVKKDGEMMELQSRPCRSGKAVNFNAVYDRFKTKLFELRLYNKENQVIARYQRRS